MFASGIDIQIRGSVSFQSEADARCDFPPPADSGAGPSEVFSQYAVLRPAEVNAPDAPTVKVKVAKAADGVSLPGFSFTQEGAF